MADNQGLLAQLLRGTQNFADGFTGAAHTLYGEGMNALMAGGRSLVRGTPYDQEMLNIKDAREQQYPGIYSVIPQVRIPAAKQSNRDEMMSTALGASLGTHLRSPIHEINIEPLPPPEPYITHAERWKMLPRATPEQIAAAERQALRSPDYAGPIHDIDVTR